MTKSISWPARAVYIVVALALALSLVLVASPAKVSADPASNCKWAKVGTPTDSNEVVLPSSNIYDFDIGPDGETVWAVGVIAENRSGSCNFTNVALWKSTDGGATWTDKTSKILTANVKAGGLGSQFAKLQHVAISPSNADFVVVAGNLTGGIPEVVVSEDGGAKFNNTNFRNSMASNFVITDIDVSPQVNDLYNVAVAVTNSSTPELFGTQGDIWRYECGGFAASWTQTTSVATATGYVGWFNCSVVTSLAFSPNWSADQTIVAISTDDYSDNVTYLQTGRWSTNTKGYGTAAGRPAKVAFQIDSTDFGANALNGTVLGNFPGSFATNYTATSGLALPSDYLGSDTSLCRVYAFVNVNTSIGSNPMGGYLFRIDNTSLSNHCGPTGHPWLASIAYHGDHDEGDAMLGMLGDSAPALATWRGPCAGVQVWRADNIDVCCPQWVGASKKPSGQANALVAFTPDGKKAYAITTGSVNATDNAPTWGDESAFSVSLDKGKCWNQLALIDTDIDNISDVAVAPDCSVSYLSTNSTGVPAAKFVCDSVWMKDANADYYADVWQRVYYKEILGLGGGGGILRLSPEHEDGDVVYWGDFGTDDLYWADSKGICKWHALDVNLNVQDFALADDDTIYAINNGSDFVKWTEATHDWTTAVDHKAVGGHTVAALGDYVLVGGNAGSVSYSDDTGATWSRLGGKGELGAGAAHIAFDSYFSDNMMVYAAMNGGDQGVWRWQVDTSSSWKDLKAEPIANTKENYYGIVLSNPDGNPKTTASTGGVLYAVGNNITPGGWLAGEVSFAARCLTPAKATCCNNVAWDFLQAGLPDTSATANFTLEPSALRLCGCLTADSDVILYAAAGDAGYEGGYTFSGGQKFNTSGQGRLWDYDDCLSKVGPTLTAVEDGIMVAADPCACENEKFTLKWDRICCDCEYDILVSLDEDFAEIFWGRDGATAYVSLKNGGAAPAASFLTYDPPDNTAPAIVVPEGILDCNTTYYWKIRARYSDETGDAIRSWWSDVWSFTVEAGPSVAIVLTSPSGNTAKDVSVSSIGFTWSDVFDADSYNFVLSANADLTSPIDSQTGITSTGYDFSGSLDYSTPYFWQVSAVKDGNADYSISNVGTFTTAAEPEAPPAAAPEPGPTQIVWPGTPSWVWIIIGLGAVLVIVVIVLIFRTRRV